MFSMFLFPVRLSSRGQNSVPLLQLDSAVCQEMSVSDTEASDVTWTDNGTFNLSEGHTPQTENSEGTFVHRRVALGGCVCVTCEDRRMLTG